jgi:hypothetical protein
MRDAKMVIDAVTLVVPGGLEFNDPLAQKVGTNLEIPELNVALLDKIPTKRGRPLGSKNKIETVVRGRGRPTKEESLTIMWERIEAMISAKD